MKFDELESDIGEIKGSSKITENSYLIEASKLYILKRNYKNLDPCYNYLESQGVMNVSYPIKRYKIGNEKYLLFDYLVEVKYPTDKKIYDLRDALLNLHEKTKVLKETKRNSFKYLYRLYKKLDYKFHILDSYISEAEMREKNDDFDWIVLSKYKTFLDAKKEMYRLQMKIHEEIDAKISIYYAINHGRPSLSHLVSKSLISFDESRFGFVVNDIARFYCSNEDIKIDWFMMIDEWLNLYELPFYKTYFKFMVMYIFILNLHIDFDNSYLSISNYIQIHNKLEKIMITFKDY